MKADNDIMNETRVPQAGVYIIIMKEGRVLLGMRKREPNKDCWVVPAGRIGFGESFESCAKREVLEETGLEIENIRQIYCTNDAFPDVHFVTVHLLADWKSGEPEDREPEKEDSWQWFDWESLPSPLSVTLGKLLETGFDPRNA
jgi:8-oxo-dGTP diphosphatase